MKNLIYLCFAITLFMATACSKDDGNSSNTINEVGTWELKEVLLDPGDGSGVFSPVTSDKTIEFKSDGTVFSNGDICSLSTDSSENSTGTYDVAGNTITPDDCGFNNGDLIYELSGESLIIDFPQCIEPCRAKYERIP